MTNTSLEQKQQEILSGLAYFTGTQNWYKHSLGLLYTDGIKYLAEEAQCYWLIDAIASYQTTKFLKDEDLQEFQIWRLEITGSSGVLICERDTDDEVLRQNVVCTDFPLPEIKLFLIQKVLMLTDEY